MDVAMPIRGVIVLGFGAILACGVGCAHWSSPSPDKDLGSVLPRPKLAPDSVVFEVTFIRIPQDQVEFSERFWPEVDEVVLPTELRRHLASNGFRCGLLGSSLPAVLQEVLDQQPLMDENGGTKTIDPGREVVARTNRLRSRTGEMGKIVMRSDPIEKLAALSYHEDGHISGESLTQAQFLFSITSFAQGNGQVRLELVPMIEHGQPKSRFRGENGAWMVDNTSRNVRLFDDMQIEATLTPGEAIAITCSDSERGLGEQFFGDDPAEKTPRLLLVVRLQQTQKDDRFVDQDALEPVASILN